MAVETTGLPASSYMLRAMPRAALVLVASLAVLGRAPRAGADDIVGTRALGMADALSAAAVGSAAVHLNPSGMTLVRGYVVEGAYGYRGTDGVSSSDASIVDTMTSRIGAGVFFNYLTASPKAGTFLPGTLPSDGKVDRSGYQLGLALALPLAEFLHLGATGKYATYESKTTGLPALDVGSGFTMDAGATLRLGSLVNLAVAGTNLIDLKTRETPVGLGFGAALFALEVLVLDFDVRFDFSSFQDAAGRDQVVPKYAFGGELFLQSFALRAGYLNDRGARYAAGRTPLPLQFATFGLSIVGKGGALDAGLRQQVSGSGDHESLFNVGLRLFLGQ